MPTTVLILWLPHAPDGLIWDEGALSPEVGSVGSKRPRSWVLRDRELARWQAWLLMKRVDRGLRTAGRADEIRRLRLVGDGDFGMVFEYWDEVALRERLVSVCAQEFAQSHRDLDVPLFEMAFWSGAGWEDLGEVMREEVLAVDEELIRYIEHADEQAVRIMIVLLHAAGVDHNLLSESLFELLADPRIGTSVAHSFLGFDIDLVFGRLLELLEAGDEVTRVNAIHALGVNMMGLSESRQKVIALSKLVDLVSDRSQPDPVRDAAAKVIASAWADDETAFREVLAVGRVEYPHALTYLGYFDAKVVTRNIELVYLTMRRTDLRGRLSIASDLLRRGGAYDVDRGRLRDEMLVLASSLDVTAALKQLVVLAQTVTDACVLGRSSLSELAWEFRLFVDLVGTSRSKPTAIMLTDQARRLSK